jgi:hypothetical protein
LWYLFGILSCLFWIDYFSAFPYLYDLLFDVLDSLLNFIHLFVCILFELI